MNRDGAFCDLHLHSTASDGTVRPAEVVRLAKEARLVAIALTDHDTFDGVAEAQEAGEKLGVRVVPGVELSVPHEGTCHVIALGADPADEGLRALAARFRRGREARNERILARLAELGMPVTAEEVAREAGGDLVARPHIARALVRRGHVRHVHEAFERFLAKGQPAYVDRDRASLAEVTATVRAAGGATILCHPLTIGYEDDAAIGAYLREAKSEGLDAVEVRYGRYTKAEETRWERLARDAGLLFSGGSDFHGTLKPGLKVGSGKGRMRVPAEWLDALLALHGR
jgi:predicted metal-dependent phosphoesterase TrpH